MVRSVSLPSGLRLWATQAARGHGAGAAARSIPVPGERRQGSRAPLLLLEGHLPRLQTAEPQPPAGALLRDRAWLLRTQTPEPGHTAPDSDLSQAAYHATTHFPHVQSSS